MKKKILFVGEYLLSFPGGAERSIWEELKKYSKKYDVEAITFDSYHKTGDFNEEGIKVTNFHLNYTLKESRFFEIFLNRR